MLRRALLCVLFLLGVIGISCNQFWIDGILEQADEVEIQFYGKGDSAVTKPLSIISITEKSEIEKISGFVSKEETEAFKCGYNGTMKFKSGGQILIDVEFNLQPDCRHVAFVLSNKIHYRKLTEEGYNYLSALHK